MSTENTFDGDAETVIQAGTTGPIHLGTGDQHTAPSFTGTTTVITGDAHGDISQTINN